jgi:tetratricopeptide (TPR) repeat protein
MKIRPEMLKKMGEMQSDPEAMFSENNPEWEEMLDKSGLAKKMQELGEMSQDGGDLMMLTFSNLKQFPFFSKASNWFLPFTMHHTALSGLSEELHTIIERLDEMSGNVCHSDMYSLALAFNQMPKMQRDIISGQFSHQLEDMEEHAKDMQYKSSMPEFDKEVVKYVRDLYRFFKLFRNASEFYNPFKDPIDFISLPAIGNMMVEEEILRLFGEFYFKRGYYKEALPIFEKLAATVHDDYGIYEKIGFCNQQLKEYRRAMDAYIKAELLHTPSQWLLRKIAVVSKRLGDYYKASEYYAKALENEPENTSLILSAGHTELEQGNIPGALVHYYHANYLQPDDVKIIRALGWLELLNSNFDKSADFYAKLSDEIATASDHLNRGHALQLAGNIKEALAEYRKSASIDRDGFCMAYEADLTTLEPLGLNLRDAHILLDAVLTE